MPLFNRFRLYAVVAILMMITESRTFTLDVGQSVRLDCEFYMDNFDMFDNPVIWKKRQHGSTSTSSQINTMRNIHRPFVGTGRFDVTLVSAAPRYHLQLGIASKSQLVDSQHNCNKKLSNCWDSSRYDNISDIVAVHNRNPKYYLCKFYFINRKGKGKGSGFI